MSAAKLQNCATVTRLKTPTQRKNGTPSGTPRAPSAAEENEVRGEEDRDARDEHEATDPRSDPAVEVGDEDQQDGLADRGVALHLGAAAEQDERLARDLEQVVGGEEQEDVDGQEQGRRRLSGPNVAEQAQGELERMFPEARLGDGCRDGAAHGRALIVRGRVIIVGCRQNRPVTPSPAPCSTTIGKGATIGPGAVDEPE